MILQASYTAVDGSNCMVFTTLHWRTQIFSDNATILAGGVDAGWIYTCREGNGFSEWHESRRPET